MLENFWSMLKSLSFYDIINMGKYIVIVLEQDVCDVVLHVVVLLLKNASAARFYSTVRRFAISFSVGVCYDLFCFIHKPLFALSIARIYEFVNSFACELPAISRRYFCVQCPTKKTTL